MEKFKFSRFCKETIALGDKGQGLIVVDFEGGVGRVAIRYDESKGATIEKKYA